MLEFYAKTLLLISLKNWVLQRTILESTTKPDGSVSTYTYYGYDNNGNQISEWTRIANVSEAADGVSLGLQREATDALLTLYEYDAFDRLVKIEQGADVIENTYTADGKKLSRTTNGEVTYYVYDGNVVIEELNETGDETARNVYGRNLITRETSDGIIVYAYNGHSDVIAIRNIDGDVLVTYTYDEFGSLIDEAVTDETYTNFDNLYRYAGYEYLEKVKLYDLNARYYNPEIARFLSPDPHYNLGNRVMGLYEINVPNAWSIIQANNIYVYCGNNSVLFIDPTGFQREAGYYTIDGVYDWYDDPDAAEFGQDSIAYKIIDRASRNWFATDDPDERKKQHAIAEHTRELADVTTKPRLL